MKNDVAQEPTLQGSGGMGLWERYLSLWGGTCYDRRGFIKSVYTSYS